MSILNLPTDLLQYIINPFINYYSDSDNLETLIHELNPYFKFNIKLHITLKPENEFLKKILGEDFREDDDFYQKMKTINQFGGRIFMFDDIMYMLDNKGGDPKIHIEYVDGQLDSIKIYYTNGKLAIIYNFKNVRLLHGLQQIFSPEGLILIKVNYKNGRIDGIYESTEFYNGKYAIRSKLNYKDGMLDGLQYTYNVNGELVGISNVQMDKSIFYEEYKQGKLTTKTYYKDSIATPYLIEYYKNNIVKYKEHIKYSTAYKKIITREQYKDGKLIESKQVDKILKEEKPKDW